MNAFTGKSIFALVASLTLITVSTASADNPKSLYMQPTLVPGQGCYELPKFGFSSFNINGYGERLTSVRWGGLAQQMGLESGDVILRLNGYPLSYHGSWNDALQQAMGQGGYVRLTVRDVRTGSIRHRETYVGGYGPVTPHFNNGPITTKKMNKPHNHPQQLSGPEQIKQIVELFD
jgi:hypothetical protein